MALAISNNSMQLGALILLMLYGAAAVILLPRELGFLKDVKQPHKWLFIIQDVLIQLCVLGVLIPCAMGTIPFDRDARLIMGIPWGFVVVSINFTTMWLVVLWTLFARNMYIHRMLKEARKEGEQVLKELIEQNNKLKKEDTGD